MKVSVICPTYNRPDRHKNLYLVFDHQTYENKELVVLDDSSEPSPFFSELQDSRVKYQHLPERMTLGLKRNRLIEKSEGEVIAHFDDDDYYAPEYLRTMAAHLKACSFVKLSKWYTWREIDKTLWLWDTSRAYPTQYSISGDTTGKDTYHLSRLRHETVRAFVDATLWGFGFSYVYIKKAALLCPFADMRHGEDYDFISRFRLQGNICKHIGDTEDLVLHFIHGQSTSLIYPQNILPSSAARAIFGDGIQDWIA